MSFFDDLQSHEHPLLLRLMLALILSAVLVFGVTLIGVMFSGVGFGAGVSSHITWLPFCLAPLMLLGLRLKKAGRLSPAMVLWLPLVIVLQYLNHLFFAGVISRWPFLIIAVVWVMAVFFALGRKRPLQLIIYSCMTAIIVLTAFLSVPKYTYARAKATLAAELKISADQLGPGLGFMPTIRCHGSSRPSIFVDSGYFFDAELEEAETYFFDPVSGRWLEANIPRVIQIQEKLDPATQRWLETLKEEGIELD